MPTSFRLLVALLWLGLVCASCGDSGGGDGHSTAPQRATLLGTASSPALDALAPLIDIGDFSDADADLLVVDCKTHAPGTLASDARVRAFLAGGRSVLFLDASQEHGTQDVIPLINGSSAGEAHALLMRRALDPHGRPEFFVYSFPGALLETPGPDSLAAFRAGARQFFERAERAPTSSNGFDPPPGLLYVIYNFTTPPTWYQFTSTKDGTDSTNGVQWTSYQTTYRYTVLLENGNVASGEQQFVAAETSTEASPLNAEQGTDKLMIAKTGSSFVTSDIGWFQVEVDVASAPQSGAYFLFQTSSPQNANGVTTVNSRVSFGVSFITPTGGTGNFSYTSNDSTELSDWAVANAGNGSVGSWAYQNQNPWIWNQPDDWDSSQPGGGVHGFGSFKVPNALATDQIQSITKMVWSTNNQVIRTLQSFTGGVDLTYLNVWSPIDTHIHSGSQKVSTPYTWSIAMQAVLPIPITTLDFSPNPVVAASTHSATGTVALELPAFVDTTVYLSSNSGNATVLPSVLIPQGQTSATFQVLVNTNGIAPGDSSVATILASNGGTAAQAQLTITN